MPLVLKLIFILIFKPAFVTSVSKFEAYYNAISNQKLSKISSVQTSVTRMRCIIDCMENASCRYVSYQSTTGTCLTGEPEPPNGTVTLYNASDWESYTITSASCDVGWYSFDGACYLIMQETTNWDDAEVACEAFGAHLADIQSEDEQNFIAKVLSEDFGPSWYWLGARDWSGDGSYTWTDGSLISSGYTYWGVFQPDNLLNPDSNELCVHILGGTSNKWNDIDCDEGGRGICEK